MPVVKINAEKIIQRDVNEQTEQEDNGPPAGSARRLSDTLNYP